MSPQEKEQAVDNRLTQWKEAVQSELQHLITEAADIRKQISTAKTATKRQYFEKKFAKVKPQVMQMVAALQKLETAEAEKATTTEATANDSSAE